MTTHKAIDRICCIVLAAVLLITILFMNGEALGITASASSMGYEDRIFDTSRVHTIDIVMDDWEGFLETCTNEEYTTCAVIIDGEAYRNVAIRAKGNTSLSSVQSYGNDRYSFKIEFDHYDSTNSYYGLDKLVLNNLIQDNTMMKDYLTYQMMLAAGAIAPLCSFSYITVNGADWGLYLSVEAVEDSYLLRNYGTNYGELYKPDSMNMGGGGGDKNFDGGNMPSFDRVQNGGEMQMPENFDPSAIFGTEGELPEGFDPSAMFEKQDAAAKDADASEDDPTQKTERTSRGGMGGGMMGSSGALLTYTDDEFDSYSVIFESAKTDITDADRARLIASLKTLNEGTDVESAVDVAANILYFAVHNFVVNFDSYTGSMIHNYYLYEEDGKLTMLPWDYNLAFGGFQGSSDAESVVNYPIDTPVSGSSVEDRPMLVWIFADAEYTEMYHEALDSFVAEYFESGYFAEMMDTVKAMIAPYVEKDPTKFCTYEEFEAGFDTLKQVCLLRAESARGQLDGTIPSTSDGQLQDKSNLVSADGISISAMGSMGGGMGGNHGDFGGDRGNKTSRDTQNAQMMPTNAQASTSTESGSLPDGLTTKPESAGNAQRPTQGQMPADGTMQGDRPTDSIPTAGETASGDVPTQGEQGGDSAQPQQPSGNFPAQGEQQSGDMQQKNPFENRGENGFSAGNMTQSSAANSWILLAVSCAVLLAGLLFAGLYKRR